MEEDNQMSEDMKRDRNEMMEYCESVNKFEGSHMIEPKYRFVNRRRSGSYITISQKDYVQLKQGKLVQYYNSKSQSPMTVRVIASSRRKHERPNENREQNLSTSTLSTMGDTCQYAMSEDQNKDDKLEREMEIGLPEPKESEDQSDSSTIVFGMFKDNHSQVGCIARSSFSNKHDRMVSSPTGGRKVIAQIHGKGTRRVKLKKLEKYSYHSRGDGDCRFKVGMKRKLDGPPANLVHRPLKKPLTLLHYCIPVVVCVVVLCHV